MEELPKGKQGPAEYRAHVEKAKGFKGSDLEYCRQNDLDKSRFVYHKQVMREKAKKSHEQSSAKVNLSTAKAIKPVSVDSGFSVPDPVWSATFLREFSRKS